MLNTARQTGQQPGPLPGVAQAQSIMQAATSGVGIPKAPSHISSGELDFVLEQAGKGNPKHIVAAAFEQAAWEETRRAKTSKGTEHTGKGKSPKQPEVVGKGPREDWSAFSEKDLKWQRFEAPTEFYCGKGADPIAPLAGGSSSSGPSSRGTSAEGPTMPGTDTIATSAAATSWTFQIFRRHKFATSHRCCF